MDDLVSDCFPFDEAFFLGTRLHGFLKDCLALNQANQDGKGSL